eukprot:m.206944 g.206944  ORF g.206944 m.206944 type:complete len:128 (+) comp18910_c2_seq6:654-1037(+)
MQRSQILDGEMKVLPKRHWQHPRNHERRVACGLASLKSRREQTTMNLCEKNFVKVKTEWQFSIGKKKGRRAIPSPTQESEIPAGSTTVAVAYATSETVESAPILSAQPLLRLKTGIIQSILRSLLLG